jgi:hypothetical protein
MARSHTVIAPAANRETTAQDNRPPLITVDQLGQDFKHLRASIALLEAKVNDAPLVVEDDEDNGAIGQVIVACREEAKRVEAQRVETKQPYLDAERTVQSFFMGMIDRLEKWQVALNARSTKYLQDKAEKARKAREEEARKAREKAEAEAKAAREAQAEADRKAAEAAAAKSAKEKVALEAQATAAAANATTLFDRSTQSAAAATTAQAAATAKPAELARTRSGGTTATLVQSWTFAVVEPTHIDLEKLRSFIPQSDIDKAIRKYVDTHSKDFKLDPVKKEALNEKGEPPLRGVRIVQTTVGQHR